MHPVLYHCTLTDINCTVSRFGAVSFQKGSVLLMVLNVDVPVHVEIGVGTRYRKGGGLAGEWTKQNS